MYANNLENERVEAQPKQRGNCPSCEGEVLSRCGAIYTWHWAHVSLGDCDAWAGEESEWRLAWKRAFPPEQVEVSVERQGERHRADAVLSDDRLAIFQHSPISPSEIAKREAFFPDMCWIFDLTELDGRLKLKMGGKKRDDYASFYWRHPRPSLAFTNATSYFDLGDVIFKPIEMNKNCRSGWGFWRDKAECMAQWGATRREPRAA